MSDSGIGEAFFWYGCSQGEFSIRSNHFRVLHPKCPSMGQRRQFTSRYEHWPLESPQQICSLSAPSQSIFPQALSHPRFWSNNQNFGCKPA